MGALVVTVTLLMCDTQALAGGSTRPQQRPGRRGVAGYTVPVPEGTRAWGWGELEEEGPRVAPWSCCLVLGSTMGSVAGGTSPGPSPGMQQGRPSRRGGWSLAGCPLRSQACDCAGTCVCADIFVWAGVLSRPSPGLLLWWARSCPRGLGVSLRRHEEQRAHITAPLLAPRESRVKEPRVTDCPWPVLATEHVPAQQPPSDTQLDRVARAPAATGEHHAVHRATQPTPPERPVAPSQTPSRQSPIFTTQTRKDGSIAPAQQRRP